MAAALLLRSLARKMARAPPVHHHPLLARGLHGSGSGASSLTKPPTRFQQGRGDQFVVGIPAAAGLRSLATKVARAPPPPHHRLLHAQRGLHSLNSTPPTSKTDFAKIRAGVAYVALFGTLVYLYGSLLPRLARLEGILEARNQSKMDAASVIEALKILLAEDASTNGPEAQIKQSSGTRAEHGKHPAGKGTKLKDLEAKINLKDLEAKMTKLELDFEAARKERSS